MNPRNSLGQTPLMVAASGRFSKHTSFLRFIISKGADINEKDRGGNSALVLAILSTARINVGILLHRRAVVKPAAKKLLTYEDPEALSLAKYIRAVDNRLPDDISDEYFEVQSFMGPSVIDRLFGIGLCSDSHHIVTMIEKAEEGTYLNSYEIHVENLQGGLMWFINKIILRKKEVAVVKKEEKKVGPSEREKPVSFVIMCFAFAFTNISCSPSPRSSKCRSLTQNQY